MAYPFYPVYQPYFQQPQPPSNGILWVDSEYEAQNYPVAPNNAVALWDSKKPMVYLKQTDASGKPTLKIYALVERTETADIKQDSTEYKDTSFALKSEIEPLLSAIAAIKADLKKIKRDMRKEVEEDDE